MIPGTFNFAPHVQGDTFRSRAVAVTINGVGASIASARWAVKRASAGTRLFSGACTVAGSTVTTPVAAGSVTENWPKGDYVHDLEITLTDGTVRTYLAGKLTVIAGIT